VSTSYSQHEAAARQLLRVASANHPWNLSSADLDATRGLDTTEAKLLAANAHLQLQLIEELRLLREAISSANPLVQGTDEQKASV
jgi:hypothetical protein